MVCSVRKGKVAERAAAHYLSELFGVKCRRGQQFAGSPESPDVVGIEGLHIEVKNCQQLNIDKALEQSVNDSASHEVPIVFHRKNRKRWKITFYADDLLQFLDTCDNVIDKKEA